LLDACTLDGKVYCVHHPLRTVDLAVAIAAYENAGLDAPTERIHGIRQARFQEAGTTLAGSAGLAAASLCAITLAVKNQDAWNGVNIDKNADALHAVQNMARLLKLSSLRA
jgi:hypothetical protein